MVKVKKIHLQGIAHHIDGIPCEDALYINEDPPVCCTADGVSNSDKGRLGAESLVKFIGRHLSNVEVLDRLNKMDSESIRKEIYQAIISTLEHISEKEKRYNINDFASTFIACFEYNNILTILHAGDGAVFADYNTNAQVYPIILSNPDNNEIDQVYQASHPETVNRLRVLRINANDIRSVVLGTDGFTNAYLNPTNMAFDSYLLSDVFKCKDDSQLEKIVKDVHLDDFNITDDITAVCMDFNIPSSTFNDKKRKFDNESDYKQLNHFDDEYTDKKKKEHVEIRRAPKRKKKINIWNRFILLVLTMMLTLSLFMSLLQMIRINKISSVLETQKDMISDIQKENESLSSKLDDCLEQNNQSLEDSDD